MILGGCYEVLKFQYNWNRKNVRMDMFAEIVFSCSPSWQCCLRWCPGFCFQVPGECFLLIVWTCVTHLWSVSPRVSFQKHRALIIPFSVVDLLYFKIQSGILNLLPIWLCHICQYSLKYCDQHFDKIINIDELHVILWTDVLGTLKRRWVNLVSDIYAIESL